LGGAANASASTSPNSANTIFLVISGTSKLSAHLNPWLPKSFAPNSPIPVLTATRPGAILPAGPNPALPGCPGVEIKLFFVFPNAFPAEGIQ
jgi:hypothetical protein